MKDAGNTGAAVASASVASAAGDRSRLGQGPPSKNFAELFLSLNLVLTPKSGFAVSGASFSVLVFVFV